jgi:pimeloyl-ACP methyl ester carboxylesterase
MEMTEHPVTHRTAVVNGLKMHYVEAGEGPPVILLHGFPETWFAWRHQIPELARQFRVIAPDLCGYGETEKPNSGYDKKNMARDVLELMQHLGIKRAPIVGHDRGACVATRFAKEYPHALERLVVIDNIPTLTIFEKMNATVARSHWFFLFNSVSELPEILIAGREEVWLRSMFSSWCYNAETLNSEEIAAYVEAYSQPGALSGAFNDYRSAEQDMAQDKEDRGKKIDCPTLVLWGEDFAAGGKTWNFREIWHHYANHPEFLSIPQCGHFPHEEKPEVVNNALLRFLSPWLRDSGTEAFFRGDAALAVTETVESVKPTAL